jgi:hypothetical protein
VPGAEVVGTLEVAAELEGVDEYALVDGVLLVADVEGADEVAGKLEEPART